MEAPLFDTRHATEKLKASGIADDHANAIVTVIDECMHGAVAKTSDLTDLKAVLQSDIADLKAELKGDIADRKAELKGDIADRKAELKGDVLALDSKFEQKFGETNTNIAQQANKTILAVIAIAAIVIAALRLLPPTP